MTAQIISGTELSKIKSDAASKIEHYCAPR